MTPQYIVQGILTDLKDKVPSKVIARRYSVSLGTVNRFRRGEVPNEEHVKVDFDSVQRQIRQHRIRWNKPNYDERSAKITSHHGRDYDAFLLRARLSG